MKAVQFTEHGEADVLQLVDVPAPEPKAGEVLIKVAAAGVNYADILQRKGTYPLPVTLPYVAGYEVAGRVESLGEGVTNLSVGQRVMAMVPSGGYAEYAVASAAQAILLPDGLGDAEATALLVQGLTAMGLFRTGHYDSLLVLAAAGGVGSVLVQIGKNEGRQVIAAVGSDDKKQQALDLGADVAVSYGNADADWVQQVRDATNGKGVSASFDAIGGQVGADALKTLAFGGTGVVFGAASGEPTMLAAQQLVGQLQGLRGYSLFGETAKFGEYAGQLFGYLQAGKLKLPLQTYSIDDVQTAHRDMESRRTQGKVALLF
ncbi:quinone oxidoreductase family protein [Spirosoma spitsbergense]|uniref:quinone oxidoreductase family protein n=1 Tax=Spirosoma spitsbergense TaxID=431554 RepID=UPI000382C2B9|nr:zinc-binding dehydrogenase [Spirosoma spitsbergense]